MSIDYPTCENCERYPGADSYCPLTGSYCDGFGFRANCSYFRQKTETVFNQITASPEVLTEKLIYWEHDECDGWWESNILDGKFDTKEEALSATVARLKEVEIDAE